MAGVIDGGSSIHQERLAALTRRTGRVNRESGRFGIRFLTELFVSSSSLLETLRMSPSFPSRTLLAATIAVLFAGILPGTADAQLRGGVSYGSDTKFGIQGGFYFPVANVSENVTFGMDGVFYFPDDGVQTGNEVRSTWVEGNVNVHYDTYRTETARLYVLGGLHYGYLNEEVIINGIPTTVETGEFGANVGGGVNVRFMFGEIRYNIGGFEQANVTIGITL